MFFNAFLHLRTELVISLHFKSGSFSPSTVKHQVSTTGSLYVAHTRDQSVVQRVPLNIVHEEINDYLKSRSD